MKKITMAWSECDIAIGVTGDNDTMATTLTSVGVIKDKSSTLEPSDGDVLEAKATGGKTVAKETMEGGYTLNTRVIEPSDELYTMLGIGEVDSEDTSTLNVKTHVVSDPYSVKLTPKNVGAKGISAPKTNITVKPGWSEEEGNYVDLEFDILKGAQDYWYKRFTKTKASDAEKSA
jgi:hypothetical protein